jgi:hypothetical protein
MEYLIGAGAILEAGEDGGITPATLHAQLRGVAPEGVAAAAIDFEAAEPAGLKRLLVMGQGFDAIRFRAGVAEPLQAQRECSLADVLRTLAKAAHTSRVHLFARWLPDAQTRESLRIAGIEVVAQPLESIDAAAIVSGQRCKRWRAA